MQSEDLKPLYLFALLLTGNSREASNLLLGTLPAVASQVGQLRHGHHSRAKLVRALRQRWLQREQPAIEGFFAGPDEEGVASFIGTMPEPERSVAALFYSDLLEAEDAAESLELSLAEYAGVLARAREKLTGLFAYEREQS